MNNGGCLGGPGAQNDGRLLSPPYTGTRLLPHETRELVFVKLSVSGRIEVVPRFFQDHYQLPLTRPQLIEKGDDLLFADCPTMVDVQAHKYVGRAALQRPTFLGLMFTISRRKMFIIDASTAPL